MPVERVHEVGAVRRGGALLGWLALLATVLAGAWHLGATPALATPPVTDPGRLAAWASGRDPVEAAFALLRLAVLAGAGYLLATTVLATCFRVLRAARLAAALDLFTVPLVRRVVQGALGAGLVGATAATAVVPSPAVAFRLVPDTVVGDGQPQPAVVAGWSGSPSPEADGEVPTGPAPGGAPTMARIDDGPPGVALAEVTLRPGDHLWATAETALATAWGRAPTDAEVAPYWHRLVATNRDRLPDPANPDLVLPGLTVVVPPAPPTP